jgi:TorA maturation chaperone TorD
MNEHQVEVGNSVGQEIPEEDLLRAQFYGLLARLFTSPPTEDLLNILRDLESDDSPMGQTLGAISYEAVQISQQDAEDEFNALFVGMVRGELMPFASVYLTGFLHEKPLADLRGDMERLGIARSDDLSQPEDQIGIICEMMHGLITGTFGSVKELSEQKEFYEAHVSTWASKFFVDLESAKSAVLFKPVGTLGRLFFEIEDEAFGMTN